ncbi:MAG: hypothetical protein WA964_00060 [Ilumatobacter sp.]|uniref:hypothetical protein n=1 Tax=Ilumatobacter sp. TaxID=1967498 RepID=UPI003C72E2AF
MLQTQIQILQLWTKAGEVIQTRLSPAYDDRGEVTAQTALIVVLVTAAIAAGAAITLAMSANTSSIPTP